VTGGMQKKAQSKCGEDVNPTEGPLSLTKKEEKEKREWTETCGSVTKGRKAILVESQENTGNPIPLLKGVEKEHGTPPKRNVISSREKRGRWKAEIGIVTMGRKGRTGEEPGKKKKRGKSFRIVEAIGLGGGGRD